MLMSNSFASSASFGSPSRSCFEQIRDPQGRRDVQQLRRAKPHDHLQQLQPLQADEPDRVFRHAAIEAAAARPAHPRW
jgi:hypothetical protein